MPGVLVAALFAATPADTTVLRVLVAMWVPK
jgi:hypothetical protein